MLYFVGTPIGNLKDVSIRAKEVLLQNGIIGKVTDTLAIAIEDKPGGFYEALELLSKNDIEIRYMYASLSHEKGKALMILSVDDLVKANKLISEEKQGNVNPSTIYRLTTKDE